MTRLPLRRSRLLSLSALGFGFLLLTFTVAHVANFAMRAGLGALDAIHTQYIGAQS